MAAISAPRHANPNTRFSNVGLTAVPHCSRILPFYSATAPGEPRNRMTHPGEGRGMEILIFRLWRGSRVASVAVNSLDAVGCCVGGGAEFLKRILGTVDLGGKRSYFFCGLIVLGSHFTRGFVRSRSVWLNFNLPYVCSQLLAISCMPVLMIN